MPSLKETKETMEGEEESIEQMEQRAVLLEAQLLELKAKIESRKRDAQKEQISVEAEAADGLANISRVGEGGDGSDNAAGEEVEPLRKRRRCPDGTTSYVCSAPGCTNYSRKGGRCIRHGEPMICSVDRCDRKVVVRGKCKRCDEDDRGIPPKSDEIGTRGRKKKVYYDGGESRVCSVLGCGRRPLKGGACREHGGVASNGSLPLPSMTDADFFSVCTCYANTGAVCGVHPSKYCSVANDSANNDATNDDTASKPGNKKRKRRSRPNPDGTTGYLCSVEWCDNFSRKDGLCVRHGAPRICGVEGCNLKVYVRGRCRRHDEGKVAETETGMSCGADETVRKVVDPATGKVVKRECRREGCMKHAKRGGFCIRHGETVFCSHEGCENKAYAWGVCRRHREDREASDA